MIRVLVVDDHPIVRGGVVALLRGQDDVDVVGEAATADDAIASAQSLNVDVVLCDLRLGAGGDGVDVTKSLRTNDSGPSVVILTTYDHDVDIVRAVEAGAAGYLLKDADPAAIVEAVRAAARGETILDDHLEARVVATMRTRRAELSPREREVLVHLAAGRSNREIARQLFLSEATVKTHLNHLYEKLGVESRTAAVAAARQTGLI
ncbi:MAG TPA: response regulator transcription factor [Phycicoccus sp.]|jgi:DNA-binding NarL/FixJ family response regulator|nr:response regulator transcription factor [Phycicoccus sp.]